MTPRYTSRDVTSAIVAYTAGQSAGDIARRLGASPRTVLDWLHEGGVAVRSRTEPAYNRVKVAAVLRCVLAGMGDRQTERATGVYRHTVCRVRRRYGIPPMSRGHRPDDTSAGMRT